MNTEREDVAYLDRHKKVHGGKQKISGAGSIDFNRILGRVSGYGGPRTIERRG
jgi:hypothetical protein